MKLSVIIPCFNVENYLREALASVCRQTYENLEILCINDGSTDSTLSILNEFAKQDPRMRVLSKVNTGYGDSVNFGLGEATGDYVCIFEPDDFIEPDMYAVLMKNAAEKDLDISRCTFFDFCEGVNKVNECRGLPKERFYCPRNLCDLSAFLQPPAIWSAVYRKDWLDLHGIRFLPTPGASFQDISFAFKTNLLADRCFAVTRPLYHYRSHANNSVKSTGKVFAPMNEYRECIAFARRRGCLDTAKAVILDIEYATYKWNYLRISSPDREAFLSRWREEWQVLYREGFYFRTPKHRLYAWLLLHACPVFRSYLDAKTQHA